MAEAAARLGAAADGMRTSKNATSDVLEGWNSIRDDSNPYVWFVCTHTGKNYPMCQTECGSQETIGGLFETCQADKIYFGGLRATVDGSVRFFHLLYVGTSVGVVKRNRSQMLKNAPFNIMEGSSGDIEFGVDDEFNVETLRQKLSEFGHTSVDFS